MANKFTQKAQNTLNRSLEIAKELGHTYIGSEHILLALLSEKDSIASRILSTKGAKAEKIRKAMIDIAGIGSESLVSADDLTPRARRIIERSSAESKKNSTKYIGTEHLLMALLEERDCMAVKLLEAEGIPASELRLDLSAYLGTTEKGYSITHSSKESEEKSKAKSSSAVSLFGRDLTDLAKRGRIDPVIGRKKETERVIQILSRRTKNNPCLIGEPGVGKTAVIEGLAQRIASGNIPSSLSEKKIIMLDLPSMIAGAKYRGEFEERLKNVMKEAAKDPNLILFVDEIHTVVGAGAAEGAVDAANIIKPALARGELQMIGATTISEYHTHIEKDAALERRFCSVIVEEPSEDEAYEILLGLRERYESHHKLKISNEALRSAVSLSARYLPDHFLPDKAIDLIDEAASKARVSSSTSPQMKKLEEALRSAENEKEQAICNQDFEAAASLRDKERAIRCEMSHLRSEIASSDYELMVTEDDIAEIITERTGIPSGNLLEDEADRLLSLEEKLCASVIGQNDAIHTVCTAVRRGRVGIKDAASPIGTFLFLGQTGVGKTELAKALARTLFGSESALIRFDMSEYMEKHSVSKLIGSPPGYVGYGEGGQLTEKVRRHPYSVILFDEIEKAHPDVFHILLQVLEDGILTDSTGRRVSFSNSILIMTSNVGAKTNLSHKVLGFASTNDLDAQKKERENTMSELKSTFKPEFLNRIDDIVFFRTLNIDDIKLIAEKMLFNVVDRATKLGIKITPHQELSAFFASQSNDREYGARPLRRLIVKSLEDSLATELLLKNIIAGDSVLAYADEESATVKFSKI